MAFLLSSLSGAFAGLLNSFEKEPPAARRIVGPGVAHFDRRQPLSGIENADECNAGTYNSGVSFPLLDGLSAGV